MTTPSLSILATPIIASAITTATIFIFYFAVTRYLLYAYRPKNGGRPYHYRMFRIYSEKIISNSPSRTEKHFYIAANRVTWVFNALFIVSVLYVLFVCYRGY